MEEEDIVLCHGGTTTMPSMTFVIIAQLAKVSHNYYYCYCCLFVVAVAIYNSVCCCCAIASTVYYYVGWVGFELCVSVVPLLKNNDIMLLFKIKSVGWSCFSKIISMRKKKLTANVHIRYPTTEQSKYSRR